MLEQDGNEPITRTIPELTATVITAFKDKPYINPNTHEPFFILSAASQILTEEISLRQSNPRKVIAQLITEMPSIEAGRFALDYTAISATDPETNDPFFELGTKILAEEAKSKDPSIGKIEDRRYKKWDK